MSALRISVEFLSRARAAGSLCYAQVVRRGKCLKKHRRDETAECREELQIAGYPAGNSARSVCITAVAAPRHRIQQPVIPSARPVGAVGPSQHARGGSFAARWTETAQVSGSSRKCGSATGRNQRPPGDLMSRSQRHVVARAPVQSTLTSVTENRGVPQIFQTRPLVPVLAVPP